MSKERKKGQGKAARANSACDSGRCSTWSLAEPSDCKALFRVHKRSSEREGRPFRGGLWPWKRGWRRLGGRLVPFCAADAQPLPAWAQASRPRVAPLLAELRTAGRTRLKSMVWLLCWDARTYSGPRRRQLQAGCEGGPSAWRGSAHGRADNRGKQRLGFNDSAVRQPKPYGSDGRGIEARTLARWGAVVRVGLTASARSSRPTRMRMTWTTSCPRCSTATSTQRWACAAAGTPHLDARTPPGEGLIRQGQGKTACAHCSCFWLNRRCSRIASAATRP